MIKWIIKWIVILITIIYLYNVGYHFIGIWADLGLVTALLLIGLLGLSHLGWGGSGQDHTIQNDGVQPPEHDYSPIKDIVYSPHTGQLYHGDAERFADEYRYDKQKEQDERQ